MSLGFVYIGRKAKSPCYYRPHTKYDGTLYFQFVCQFTPGGGWGGGLPYLHPIIFPLVPCPIQGVLQSQVRGTPSPPASQNGVPPWRGQDGIATPLPQPGLRYSLARSGWGTTFGQDRVSPRDRLHLDRSCRKRHACCSFPQEDFLVSFYEDPGKFSLSPQYNCTELICTRRPTSLKMWTL